MNRKGAPAFTAPLVDGAHRVLCAVSRTETPRVTPVTFPPCGVTELVRSDAPDVNVGWPIRCITSARVPVTIIVQVERELGDLVPTVRPVGNENLAEWGVPQNTRRDVVKVAVVDSAVRRLTGQVRRPPAARLLARMDEVRLSGRIIGWVIPLGCAINDPGSETISRNVAAEEVVLVVASGPTGEIEIASRMAVRCRAAHHTGGHERRKAASEEARRKLHCSDPCLDPGEQIEMLSTRQPESCRL